MSNETRFDKLEGEIVDALRRAPGAEPSADLDARILARAHAAVARPARRLQPIWFSMAAGLVVLVGSGLALRIWQQLEQVPSPLDAPPPASAPARSGDEFKVDAAAPADPVADAINEPAKAAREQTVPSTAAPAPAPARLPATAPGSELRRSDIAVDSDSGALSDLSATAKSAERSVPAAAPMPRPFPAEPGPVVAKPAQPAPASGLAAAPESVAPPPPAPAPAMEAPPMQATVPAAEMGLQQPAASAKREAAASRAAEGATATGRDASDYGAAADDSEDHHQRNRQEEQGADAYAAALARVREAVAAGDPQLARRLALELQRAYPQRELPEDLRELVDRPQ